ncbi:MAG: hypothetical protein A2Y00_07755 [Omnitrophica WOR_2 bacterium GWF2_43_52]|nr:MAG: hypothetical protein A2Y00_07755 [Omnitrophica WOR_2 bacterium GWF2_43_52]HAH22041.1 hypothetical protein [Candidatus Omnitrophota bacterium]HBG62718.1 hypothetical protein [Candidatus Omnitrophota bacterium]
MSSYKNKNNKGVALILALGVSSVLLTLGMAYVGGAIQESNLSQRYQDSMASLYEAERGVQYAVLEARNSGWQFLTHNVNPDRTLARQTGPALIPIIISDAQRTVGFEADGDYSIVSPASRIEVRTYIDAVLDPQDIFVLARSTSLATSTQKIIKLRVGANSLYQYQMFTPGSMELRSIDGRGIGMIHANGNIQWQTNGNARNLESVDCAGFMRYSYSYRVPAYLLDGLDGIMDGNAPLPNGSSTYREWNLNDYNTWYSGLTAAQQTQAVAPPTVPYNTPSNVNNFPWLKLNWWYNSNQNYSWHPSWASIQGDFASASLQQNSGVSYNWNEAVDTSNSGGLSPHYNWSFGSVASYPIFYNTLGSNFDTYNGIGNYDYTNFRNQSVDNSRVDSLFGSGMRINGVQIPFRLTGGDSYQFDPFYKDPVVDAPRTVRYANTELLPNNWSTFSNGATIPNNFMGDPQPHALEPLSAILKDRNNGGKYIDPVPVDSAYFSSLAATGGIVIRCDGTITNRADIPLGVISTSSFINHIHPSLVGGVPQPDQVVNVDIGTLKNWAAANNFNGVIYFDGSSCSGSSGIRLKNAKELPDQTATNTSGGLSVYSTRQVYLQGDFNYDSTRSDSYNEDIWQPGSVIATSRVYYLSDGFSDPQTLPTLVHNRNWPQITDAPSALMYWTNNVGNMPNEAAPEAGSQSTVTYRASIVSTDSLWQDNILERWRNGRTGPDYRRRIIGAQVAINGTNNVVSSWNRGRSWGGPAPFLTSSYDGGATTFEYDPMLLQRTPPGDFLAGFEASWQEVSDFDNA